MKSMENVALNGKSSPTRIVGIVCSPHKDGMTHRLVRQALAGAKAKGADVFLEFLADEEMEACRACGGNCWETCECVRKPISADRMKRLQEADGLVMAVPVYFWQMNGMTHLFIDKMRWDTGSVLTPRNRRAAFGIACAGGSGTGCVMALQALYRYFYNWSFHGIHPLPVTRFNFEQALEEAYVGGGELVDAIRRGLEPFPGLGAAMADLDALPHMMDGAVDELRLIVRQLQAGIDISSGLLAGVLHSEARLAGEAWEAGDRQLAAEHFGRAYEAGNKAWAIDRN
jgi:NAD(P)H-dependent FMN reductase